jgi:sulfite exporter TauE/SafE
MSELPLVFFGGLLGSAHCIGMCGPMALALGAGWPLASNLRRQLVYSAGRISTYAFCGAAAAFGSLWIASQTRYLLLAQAWLAILAGLLLLLIGLASAGLLPAPAARVAATAPCGAAGVIKALLNTPGWTGAFLAGVATGFIPCGLVYAFLLKAASAGSVWLGGICMAAFGLGTVPLMVATGCGGAMLSTATRTRALRLAALCVVAAGVVTIVRGAGQLEAARGGVVAPCPFCAQ